MKKLLLIFICAILLGIGISQVSFERAMGAVVNIFTVKQGGTGTASVPSYGEVLIGTSDGKYTPVATSTLGITGAAGAAGGNDFTYNTDIGFGVTGSATTTKTKFTAGIHASGTSQFDNATSTLFTATTAWLTNLFIGADTIAEYIADTAGAFFTGNTETGITVTYQDADNTVDVVCDTASGSIFGCLASADWTTFNNKLTSLGSGFATTTEATITFSSTTKSFNGLTFGQTIVPSASALMFTPTVTGTLDNTGLTNSSVSYGGVSVSLGASDATPAFNLADATGLPISTGISGLGSNVATFLATPSSANLASALTGETGTGGAVFDTSPTFITQLTTPIVVGTSYSATSTFPHASTTDLLVNGILDLWGTAASTFAGLVAKIEAIFVTNNHTYTGGTVQDFTAVTVKQQHYPTFTWPGVATTTTATTTVPLGSAGVGQQWNWADCKVTNSTGGLQFKDDSANKMDYKTLSTSYASTTLTTNNTFTYHEGRNVDIGPLTNAQVTCTVNHQDN